MKKPLPKYTDIYGSQYVSPEDFPNGKQVLMKILSLEAIELTCIKGGRPVKNVKIVATCQGSKKKLAINKTSAKRMAMEWTQDFNLWVGKSISVTGGEVNGKPATLCTPIREDGRSSEPYDDQTGEVLDVPEQEIQQPRRRSEPQQPALDAALDNADSGAAVDAPEPGAREFEETTVGVTAVDPKAKGWWAVSADDGKVYWTKIKKTAEYCTAKQQNAKQAKITFEVTKTGNLIERVI